MIVSFNKNNEFVASRRSWEETKSKLLEYLITKHQKLEFLILYTQNYISDFEKASIQLLVCFTIYCILHCDRLQIRSFIKALTSLASYIQNQLKVHRDHIMSISSTSSRHQISYSKFQSIIALMIFDLKYLALICNRHSNTNISIHNEDLKKANR